LESTARTPGWKDEEASKFSPRDLNALIHSTKLRPFRFFGSTSRQRIRTSHPLRKIPSHAYTISRTFGTSDTDTQYVPLLDHPTMVMTTKGGDKEEVEEEAILLTPNHWILPDLLVTKSSPNST